ncbi:BQ2448_5222 [Microbotryum intermedium]|uniref:ubiquitinyl hydrolase 1 n=1 Tax=Microbotryum intermedium TaxID=269621 RepID=A0A238F6E2_9BASI|nr:BQ2448_5222 [Microbotryum intermedium]
MDDSSSRAPTPMATLKRQADVAPFTSQPHTVKAWLTKAKQSFDTSQRKWMLGKPPKSDARQIEAAYVALRMGAEFSKLARAHPGYKNMSTSDKALFGEVERQLSRMSSVQPEMVGWLEQREREWNDRFGGLGGRTSNRGDATASTSRASTSRDTIDQSAYASGTSSGADPTSAHVISITERLANLRASGMAMNNTRPTNGTGQSSIPRTIPLPMALRHAAVPKAPQTPDLDGFDPSSSAMRKGDFVSDKAVERTGSAPPVIPQLNDQNGLYNDGVTAGNGFVPSSGTRSDIAPSPTGATFDSRFPGLDDFEKLTGSNYSFPAVPSFEPGAKAGGSSAVPSGFPAPLRPSTSATPPSRPDLPSGVVPGGRRAAPPPPLPSSSSSSTPSSRARSGSSDSASLLSRPPPAPPSPSSTRHFDIPFTNEVTPLALHHYLHQALAESGRGPRVLLLDIRSREEYTRGRIMGESVCLEPIILRNGISSNDLESALTLSPNQEQRLFAARNCYDVVIVYDRASTTLPTVAPHSTSSEAQRVLWNLIVAIYEREFQKSLKRQPVLLKGGWEAWEKHIGSKGIEGEGLRAASGPSERRGSAGSESDMSRDEVKKANRKTSVVTNPGGTTVMRNGAGTSSSSAGSSTFSSNGFFKAQSSGFASSSSMPSSAGTLSSGMMSPRLTMPPQAAQPSTVRPSFDSGFVNSGYNPSSSTTAYSPHPPQPYLNGMSSSQSLSYPSPSQNGSPTMSRTFESYGDLHSQSSSSFTPRGSIDYPQLHGRALPGIPLSTSSMRPSAAPALPAVPLTRPPAVRAAPQRSNSSFTGVSINSYSSNHSNFPSNFSFDNNAIGLTGLKNLGNTCYMNSTIQCLSAAIPFARYFKDRSYQRDINVTNPLGTRGALADAVSELIRAIWAQQYMFLSPVTFRENICRFAPQFRGSDQHDAQEFLGFLLDGLHEDLNYVTNKPAPIEMTPDREHDLETLPPQLMSDREWEIYKMRNDSFVVQCFQGQFRNQLKCLTCGKTSTTYNTFMPLSIPIPSGRGITKTTLYECIQGFVREEILDKDDAWFCPRCKTNRKATKKLSLSRLPPILVIHLKRFSFHGPFSDKIETFVQYPLSGLDLTSFIPPPLMDTRSNAASSKMPPEGYVYDLFGVTNHYGNLSSGHYTAYVRSGRDWHNIGDSKVTPVDPRIVEGNKSAYILYLALRQ